MDRSYLLLEIAITCVKQLNEEADVNARLQILRKVIRDLTSLESDIHDEEVLKHALIEYFAAFSVVCETLSNDEYKNYLAELEIDIRRLDVRAEAIWSADSRDDSDEVFASEAMDGAPAPGGAAPPSDDEDDSSFGTAESSFDDIFSESKFSSRETPLPSANYSKFERDLYERPKSKDLEESDFDDMPGSSPPLASMDAAADGIYPAEEPINDEIVLPIHYATTRRDTREDDPNKVYGRKRADRKKTHYGVVNVTVPRTHKIGRIERPKWYKVEFSENPKKHFTLKDICKMGHSQFFSSIGARLDEIRSNKVFVFIHGFNVSFAEAAYQTAQMTYDLFDESLSEEIENLVAAPLMFSWASYGSLFGYGGDRDAADIAAARLASVVRDLRQQIGDVEISVIAHSMGNKVLLGCLKSLAKYMLREGEKTPLISEVILAAPDVDKEIFLESADDVRLVGKRTTLYATKNDMALAVSRRFFNRYRRLGDLRDGVPVLDDMDTIDATNVGENLLKHSPHASSSVIRDMFTLMTSGAEPALRAGLECITLDADPPVRYWRLR